MTYKEFCEAYKQAKHQRDCHADMVSGCWRIRGEDFCEQYKLDYDDAQAYEDETLNEEYIDLYHEERAQLEKQIGELTEQQLEFLEARCLEEVDWDNEGYNFWHNLLEQLEDKYPKLCEQYYQNEVYNR